LSIRNILTLTIFTLLLPLNGLTCETVYLNTKGETSLIEANVIKEVSSRLQSQFQGISIHESNFLIYSTIQNDIELNPKAVIIDINSETDMTGPDVKVSVFRSDAEGFISFQGSDRRATNSFTKGKYQELLKLTQTAINFSCGN